MHVVDIKWRSASSGNFELGFLSWPQDSSEVEFHLLRIGQAISWEILGPRLCVGYRDSDGRLVECPERSTILRHGTRCGPCSAMDNYDACMRCDGKDCTASAERRRACKESEYAVYLALFGESTVKVGVSTLRRVQIRWIEQGADYGVVLSVIKDGQEARRLESLLDKLSSVVKQVRSSRKVSGLHAKMTPSMAKAALEGFLESQTVIKRSDIFEITDLSQYYDLGGLDARPQMWFKNSDQVAGQKMLGEIVGAKGSLLVTRIAGSYKVADLRRLVGYTISMDAEIEISTQSGLDDFI
ncbi:MAG: DUF2797 domain-containing protein [Candidatus Thorarchaeota archaeon]|nr:MAG: DUF2797 domain-containing protein [Candidatus Thorarchaeota archaeon]